MQAHRFRTAVVLAFAAGTFAVGSIAQDALQPTGHRHKLRHVPPKPRPPDNGNVAAFGQPLVGLTAAEKAAFDAGREEFESVETADGGLGPIFNDVSCASCHTTPVSGGASETTVTRFGLRAHGRFDPLEDKGGSLLQAKAIDPSLQEVVPDAANVVTARLTTPLFGAGLLEAISDDSIRANAARRQPDGITGRAAEIVDVVTGKPRVGRLGWKAQHASLLAFAGDAYLNEMGVTNRFFPNENAPNGNQALLRRFVPNPVIDDPVDASGRSDIDAAADFMRLLAPPPASRKGGAALAGQRIFAALNCDACHQPTMQTGASSVAALSHQVVPLYSDLLLHNMGSLGDGIEQGDARGHELRTAPLWGLRERTRLLHDGRALNARDAILAHAGEATASRERFKRLDDDQTRALLAFLAAI